MDKTVLLVNEDFGPHINAWLAKDMPDMIVIDSMTAHMEAVDYKVKDMWMPRSMMVEYAMPRVPDKVEGGHYNGTCTGKHSEAREKRGRARKAKKRSKRK